MTRGGDMEYHELRLFKDEVLNDASYTSHDVYQLKKNLFQTTLTYNWKINDRNSIHTVNRFRYDWYSREYTESNMFDRSGARYEGTRGYARLHDTPECNGASEEGWPWPCQMVLSVPIPRLLLYYCLCLPQGR